MITNIPLTSLRRDEIYTFIGGFLLAAIWYYYFLKSTGEQAPKIDMFTNITFIILWLSSTALLYIILSLTAFVCIKFISRFLATKTSDDLRIRIGVEDPVETFYYYDSLDEVKFSIHLISIVLCTSLLSVYPVYNLILSHATVRGLRFFALVAVILILVMAFLYYRLMLVFIIYNRLRALHLIDFIDTKKYNEERAIFFAQTKNKMSEQKLRNFRNTSSEK
jgi:hypothetical protein